jgi:hypothetical protein
MSTMTADIRNPRKRQARLDDNGEPAGVPAPKKVKSAQQNGQKKKKPTKTSAGKKKSTAPAKNTPSVETGVSDPVDKTTNRQEPPVNRQEPTAVGSDSSSSDDDVVVVEDDEEPEEDDEAELGAYLLSNKIVSC